jgi:hypothetical protein
MKKLILLFTAIAMVGCSNDDDSSDTSAGTSFSLDGDQYQLLDEAGMSEIVMADAYEVDGVSYDRSTITVTGLNGMTTTGSVSFDLYYKTGTSVAGTYTIYNPENEDSVGEEFFLTGQDRVCMGWTSMASIFTFDGGIDMNNANNPEGTVEVIVNSATNYTLKYNGNFRVYENGFDFVGNMPADINVVSDVTTE